MATIVRIVQFEGSDDQVKQQYSNSMIDGDHPFTSAVKVRTLDRGCLWTWDSGTGIPEDEVRADKMYCSERQAMDAADKQRYEDWKDDLDGVSPSDLPVPDPLMWKRDAESQWMVAEDGDSTTWQVYPVEIEVD